MAMVKCILGIVVLFTVSVWTEAAVLGNSFEKNVQSVSEILALANKHLSGDSFIVDGDIAVSRRVWRNADPCVNTGCKWPQATDGKVYIPYTLSTRFLSSSRSVIQQAMNSFSQSTCIRFRPRNYESNYLNIQPQRGCWSYLGRQGGAQDLSLQQPGCITSGTVQHELLHALGFHHEQNRSDRDHYIKVLWENIEYGKARQFQKVNTLNQGTPYDYSSVMHYHSKAFSMNGRPTLKPLRRNVSIGTAMRMSPFDIYRVNCLYCNKC